MHTHTHTHTHKGKFFLQAEILSMCENTVSPSHACVRAHTHTHTHSFAFTFSLSLLSLTHTHTDFSLLLPVSRSHLRALSFNSAFY